MSIKQQNLIAEVCKKTNVLIDRLEKSEQDDEEVILVLEETVERLNNILVGVEQDPEEEETTQRINVVSDNFEESVE